MSIKTMEQMNGEAVQRKLATIADDLTELAANAQRVSKELDNPRAHFGTDSVYADPVLGFVRNLMWTLANMNIDNLALDAAEADIARVKEV